MITDEARIRVLLVGGGSGGHFYPLVAIAEALHAAPTPVSLYYAGPDAYDAEALAKQSITFVRISSGKQRRYASILNFFDGFKTCFGIISALCKLYVVYPDVVISKGGYTSVPVVIAAWLLRIPIIVHESDSVIGRANKLAVHFAHDVLISYDELREHIKHERVQKVGIPIRTELLAPPTSTAIERFAIDPNRPLILILGGSQGAERINSLVLDALDELLGEFSIIHQTGTQHFETTRSSAERLIPNPEVRKHYHPYPFLNGEELNDAYHIAGIIVSRAGSNSIYEIALHGKPAILIPIPEDVSHDQRSNSYAYARHGGAVVMEEKNLSDGLLRSEIDRIMHDMTVYESMQQAALSFGTRNAAERIGTLAIELAEYH